MENFTQTIKQNKQLEENKTYFFKVNNARKYIPKKYLYDLYNIGKTIIAETKGMQKVDKIKYIYELICTTTGYCFYKDYKSDNLKDNYGMHGVFLTKYATCDAIAETFLFAGQLVDLEIDLVKCTANGERHTFNSCVIEGKKMYFDAIKEYLENDNFTSAPFPKQKQELNYKYFMVDKNFLIKNGYTTECVYDEYFILKDDEMEKVNLSERIYETGKIDNNLRKYCIRKTKKTFGEFGETKNQENQNIAV